MGTQGNESNLYLPPNDISGVRERGSQASTVLQKVYLPGETLMRVNIAAYFCPFSLFDGFLKIGL
jgi:hypothetical protein